MAALPTSAGSGRTVPTVGRATRAFYRRHHRRRRAVPSRRIAAFTATKPAFTARSATPAGGRPTWLAQPLVAVTTATSLAAFMQPFMPPITAAVAAAGHILNAL